MAQYRFVTVWRIEAPLPEVCEAVSQSQKWPDWWRGVERVEIFDPGDPDGIGGLRRFTWKGRLPYRLTFDIRVTRAVPRSYLEGRASGELEGVGCWHFTSDGEVTVVRYEWTVRTTRRWMNLLAPVARPLFKWNHHHIMRQGAEGMARLLDARLITIRSFELRVSGLELS